MKSIRSGLTAVALLTCTMIAAQEPAPAPEQQARVLAVVEGMQITDQDLWWYMEQTSGGAILDDLILHRLLQAEADGRQINIGEPLVDDALARLREGHDSEADFERWLRESGQTLKGLRMQLQQELLIDRLLEERMDLTDEGIRRYYESHPHEFTRPPRVHLLDIVTASLDEAFAVRERLAAGEVFAEVAREMSRDGTAAQGGDRGWLTPDDVLNEPVRQAVFALEQGQVSDPVQYEDHVHVFLARQVEPERVVDFEQARPEVIKRIRERRGISEELFLALLKRRAQIQVEWPAHSYLNEYYADLRRIKLVVDDQGIDLPADPRLLPNSNLIVPAKALLEAMGAEVTWNEQAGVLEVSRDGVTMRLIRGMSVLAVGDEERDMAEPLRHEDGVLMVAPRAPVQALGGALHWNRAENTLYVDSYDEDAVSENAELP